MSKFNVLFLCTGNSCRSIMAEALLRHRFGEQFDAYSAGMAPKGIHQMTVQVLDEIGVDTKVLRSKDVKELLGKLPVHHLIVVCDNAEQTCPRIWPGVVARHFWPLDDPPAFEGTEAERLAEFRRVRDEIGERIEAWVQDLTRAGSVEPHLAH